MPRLKLNDDVIVPCRRSGSPRENGLRSNQYTYEGDPVPRTQREKDDRFDMYRDDQRTVQRTKTQRPKKKRTHEPKQLWYAASLICAVGAFCLFSGSVMVYDYGIVLRLTSFDVLQYAIKSPGALPSPVVCMSAMPAVFAVMFILFAFMKERTFDKASLALVAISVFVIVLQIFWTAQMSKAEKGYGYELVPDYGIMIEIACAVGLMIVIACQRIMNIMAVRKDVW